MEDLQLIHARRKNVSSSLQLTLKEVMMELIQKSQQELPFSMNVKDLKRILPHSETKIYLMLESGELPARKIGGKWVIPRDQFLAWYYGAEFAEEQEYSYMR